MNLLINIGIISNILLILLFGTAFVLGMKENSNPKLRAKIGTYLAVVICVYFICFGSLSIVGLALKDLQLLCLVFFIAVFFIIGRFVTYKTLKLFSVIQLFSFLLSLYMLFLIK